MILRPESRPISYKKLGEPQKKAFSEIIKLLAEAVDTIHEDTIDPMLTRSGWLESNRSSRILFVSGERGTGKSTLLASLVAAEGENFFSKNGEQIPTEEIKIKMDLEKIRHRIIWLEPIDMEIIPSAFNLLGAILARIERAIEHASQNSNSKSFHTIGTLEIGTGYQDALMALQRLQTNLALAWDGNLEARAGNLDSDAFAMEAKRTERSRLSINQELAKTLDKLVKYVLPVSKINDPIFVLPIDDFDLNPKLCINFLKMIRMISVPRLFTIVMGDILVAEVLIKLKTMKDFKQDINTLQVDPPLVNLQISIKKDGETSWSIRNEGNSALLSLGKEDRELDQQISHLASNAINKLIPLKQRVEITKIGWQDTKIFTPIFYQESKSFHLPNFANLLEQIPILLNNKIGTKVTNLYGLFEDESQGIELTSIKKRRLEARRYKLPVNDWQTVIFSDVTPRHITDLWIAFKEIISSEQYQSLSKKDNTSNLVPDIIDIFINFGERLIKEKRELEEEQRKNLLSIFNDIYDLNYGQENPYLCTHINLDKVITKESSSKFGEEIFTITTQCIEKLKKENVSDVTKRKLESLKDKKIVGETSLFDILKIEEDDLEHRTLIKEYSSGEVEVSFSFSLASSLKLYIHNNSNNYYNQNFDRQKIPISIMSLTGVINDLLSINHINRFIKGFGEGDNNTNNDHLAFTKLPSNVANFNQGQKLSWPAPRYKTFRELTFFLKYWNEKLNKTEGNKLVEVLFFYWIATIIALLDYGPIIGLKKFSVESLDWEELENRMEKLAAKCTREDDDYLRKQLINIIWMFTPEVGVSATLTYSHKNTGFFSNPDLKNFCLNNKENIKLKRRKELGSLNKRYIETFKNMNNSFFSAELAEELWPENLQTFVTQ